MTPVIPAKAGIESILLQIPAFAVEKVAGSSSQ
jgi:hypothetical protein